MSFPNDLYIIKEQNSQILSSTFQNDKIFLGLSNGDLLLFNKNKKDKVKTSNFKINSSSILDLAVNENHNYLAASFIDNTIKLLNFNSEDKYTVKNINIHSASVKCINFSNNGKYLLSSSHDKTTKLSNIYSGTSKKTFKSHTNWVTSNLFINNDKYIVTGSVDKNVYIQDIETSKILKKIDKINSKVNKLDKLSDESCFGIATNNGFLKIFDSRSGSIVQNYNIDNKGINDFKFHPSGLYLLCAYNENQIDLFDLRLSKNIFSIKAHKSRINTIAIHNKENIFLTGSNDKKACIWNYEFDILYNEVKESVLTNYFAKEPKITKINYEKWNISKEIKQKLQQKNVIREIKEDPVIINTFDKIISQLSKMDLTLDNIIERLDINEEKIIELNRMAFI